MSLENTPATRGSASLREISDADTMRALTHPVRIALIEQLTLGGPMTATQVGERIGESATTCSFHLRQLAKYGFVEEAGGGRGRSRPWKMTSIGMTLSSDGSPEGEIARRALSRLIRDRYFQRLQEWLEARPSFPPEWRRAAIDSEHVFHVTAEEALLLNEEIHELLMSRYRERLDDPSLRPEGSVPFEILTFGYPMELPRA